MVHPIPGSKRRSRSLLLKRSITLRSPDSKPLSSSLLSDLRLLYSHFLQLHKHWGFSIGLFEYRKPLLADPVRRHVYFVVLLEQAWLGGFEMETCASASSLHVGRLGIKGSD